MRDGKRPEAHTRFENTKLEVLPLTVFSGRVDEVLISCHIQSKALFTEQEQIICRKSEPTETDL